MIHRILRSPRFWTPFILTLIPTAYLLAWELHLVEGPIVLTRPIPTTIEWIFALMLILFLPLNMGLAFWQMCYGHCPRGSKRASGIAGVMGVVTLICPVCVALPLAFVGLSTVLAVLTPLLPLLRVIAVVLLGTATWLLWPRKM